MASSLTLSLLLVPLAAGMYPPPPPPPTPSPPTDLYGKQANIDYDHGKVVNDYSREQPRCTMVDKVEYKDVCEPYTERELHRRHRDQAGQEVLRRHRAHLRPQGGGGFSTESIATVASDEAPTLATKEAHGGAKELLQAPATFHKFQISTISKCTANLMRPARLHCF